jgi:L-alanine-DL-glutamate epimerase-like enolase superfamily enzyme
MDIGRRIEDLHLYWLEDVTAHDDFAGLARVADALSTRLPEENIRLVSSRSGTCLKRAPSTSP